MIKEDIQAALTNKDILENTPSLILEENYLKKLADNRSIDALTKKTTDGPHSADLRMYYGKNNREAKLCSFGEQKSLITGLILAHAKLIFETSRIKPIILLDDLDAHFDNHHKESLLKAIKTISGQIWITGTSDNFFRKIYPQATFIKVQNGCLSNF